MKKTINLSVEAWEMLDEMVAARKDPTGTAFNGTRDWTGSGVIEELIRLRYYAERELAERYRRSAGYVMPA
jgi:hypothetical protein